MSDGKIDVGYLLRLSRIHVEEEEWSALERQLSSVLSWVSKLEKVDTSGVEPLTSGSFETLSRRDDAVTAGGDVEGVLSNAPDRFMDFYVVPKVVE